jgi:hypothetical protein
MKEILSRETEKKLRKLDALERGGVDSWEFYGEALNEFFEENQLVESIEDLVTEIEEIICTNIEQPAGTGCGYGVKDTGRQELINLLINRIERLKNK